MNHEFIYSQTAQYIISNNILAPPPPPLQHVQPLRNWNGKRAASPHSGGRGGGGGVECDQILDPLKNKISDIRPPKKSNIRYLAFTKIRYLA